MSHKTFYLDNWSKLSLAEQAKAARKLLDSLPEEFHYLGIQTNALGGQQHSTAFYEWNGTKFTLIPGQESITLGFDHSNPIFTKVVLPKDMTEAEWEFLEREHLAGSPKEDVLYKELRPLRTVTIVPFLLETIASEPWLTPVPLEDPLVRWGDDLKPGEQRQIIFDRTVRISMQQSGVAEAFEVHHPTYPEVQALISKDGFRFPTSDEWEYACAAGTRTIFRWGNEYPVHYLPDERTPEWNLHHRPNAFGLTIADHAYHWEFTSEFSVMRGGDGGNAICGGEGPLAAWLTLASSFETKWGRNTDDKIYYARLRRALSLP